MTNKIILRGTAVLSLFLSLNVLAAQTKQVSVTDLLKQADDIRNPADSFRMLVQVEDTEEGTSSKFEVFTWGKDKTLIKTLEPIRDRGRNSLMLEDNMWAFIPNLKRAVRVSLNQKLTGQAANGDISRMRWYGDYAPSLEKETPKEYVLLLKAQRKGLTYDNIRAWIEKDTSRPLRAEYLSTGLMPLKKATFADYKLMAGGIRPLKITIEDAISAKKSSVIQILEMEVKKFPASLFHQNSLSD